MGIDRNSFYKYQENRAQTGYGAALLCKAPTDAKYSMVLAGETVPEIFGSPESFEFDLLNSPVKGKVAGKTALEDTEVQFLLHRDNLYRLKELKDKGVLEFLYVTSDLVGFKFTGTIDYHPNEASADILRGTYTISPMSADPNPIFDCSDIVQETLILEANIPDTIDANTVTEIPLAVKQSGEATNYSVYKLDKNGNKVGNEMGTSDGVTVSGTPEALTITKADAVNGLYILTYDPVDTNSGYSGWFTTFRVINGKEPAT